MKITWQIEKKRGHNRPSLSYKIVLEDFERELVVPQLNIQSTIPKLPHSREPYCLPGEHERAPGWQPEEYHMISVPFYREGELEGFLRLPFRESGEYPEVEESFLLLREKYEQIVREAYAHEPLDIRGELDLSAETKKAIAAKLTAKKILSLCA